MVLPQFCSLYTQTNKQIFQVLRKGLLQEKKEDYRLFREESSLKREIARQTNFLKKEKAEEKKEFLAKRLNELKKNLDGLREEITNKSQLQRSTERAIVSVKREILQKKERSAALEKNLEKELKGLVNKRDEEFQKNHQSLSHLQHDLNELLREKSKLQQLMQEELKKTQGEIDEEKDQQEKRFPWLQKRSRELILQRQSHHSEQKRELAFAEIQLKKLLGEQEALEKHFIAIDQRLEKGGVTLHHPQSLFSQSLREGLEKLDKSRHIQSDFKHNVRQKEKNSRYQIEEAEKKLAALTPRIQRLQQEMQKIRLELGKLGELETKKKELTEGLVQQSQRGEALRRALQETIKEKETLNGKIAETRQNIRVQEKTVREEEAKIKQPLEKTLAFYRNQIDAYALQRKNVENKLVHLHHEKERALKLLEKDKDALNGLSDGLCAVERQFAKEEQREQNRAEEVLEEIKAHKKESHTSYQKLKQVDRLLEKVKKMALGSPELAGSFNQEENKIKKEISHLDQEIVKDENKFRHFHHAISVYQEHFQQKRKRIGELQNKTLAEKSKHQKVLGEISQELGSLQNKLESLKQKISSFQGAEQKETLHTHVLIANKLGDIKSQIAKKQNAYRHTLSLKKQSEEKIKSLNEMLEQSLSKINHNHQRLMQCQSKIAVLKEKKKSLEEEGELLHQLLRRLAQEKESKQRAKNDMVSTHAEAERREAVRAQEMDTMITRFFSSLQEKKEKELAALSEYYAGLKNSLEARLDLLAKEIHQEKEKKEALGIELQKKGSKLNKERADEKKQFEKNKKRLQGEVSSLFQKKGHLQQQKRNASLSQSRLEERVSSVQKRILWVQKQRRLLEARLSLREEEQQRLKRLMAEREKHLTEEKLLGREIQQVKAAVAGRLKSPALKQKVRKMKAEEIIRKGEMKKFLKTMDNLLGKLPSKEIGHFAKSKNFNSYKKIMGKYGLK